MSDRKELIARLRAAAIDHNVLVGKGLYLKSLCAEAATALEEAQGVPVAWMFPMGERGLIEWGAQRPDYPNGGLDWQPLYAAAAVPTTAQGVPREPTRMALCEIERVVLHAGQLYEFVQMPGCAACAAYAAPAAPTREPVSAAVQRDEQDARRYRWLRDWDKHNHELFVCANRPGPDPSGAELDAEIDAALAEPKR